MRTGIQQTYIGRWLRCVHRRVTLRHDVVVDDVAGRGSGIHSIYAVRGVRGMGGLVLLQSEGATAIDIPQEWGIVGFVCAILLSMLGLFTWWVRGARQDQREATHALVEYMQNEARATANALQVMTLEIQLDRTERQEFQVRLLDAIAHITTRRT